MTVTVLLVMATVVGAFAGSRFVADEEWRRWRSGIRTRDRLVCALAEARPIRRKR